MRELFSLPTSGELSLDRYTLEFLADALPHQIWMADARGHIFFWNQKWYASNGLLINKSKGLDWEQIVHPEDYPAMRQTWQNALVQGQDLLTEARLHTSEGNYRWQEIRGSVRRDIEGTILLWVGTVTESEERKQEELTLKAREENFHLFTELLPQLAWVTRSDGFVEYCNQRYYDYTHARPEQILGYAWRQLLHPEDYARVIATRHLSLAQGNLYDIEYRLRDCQAGTYRWFLTRGIPVYGDSNQIIKWFGTSTDIEEQKQIEENLRRSQERVHALMESAIIGIAVAEGQTIVEMNDALLQLTGYTREEVEQRSLNTSTIMFPEYTSRDQQALQELATNKQITPYETTYVCKDGSLLPALVGVVALPHDPQQTIAFVLDNSDRKELEQRKDDFMSMASHEFKTPLTVLRMQIQLLQKQRARGEAHNITPALAKMGSQVARLTKLTEELLDVSKIAAGKMTYAREQVDISKLLHELADTLHQMYPTHTILVHNAAPVTLIGDKDRLEQVFINLLSNAIKYSPEANSVEVDLHPSLETLTINVRDHGIGIPRAQREKIFERFYRAIASEQKALTGLGMGLYISAEIIKRHGGTIRVKSELKKGSTFSVTLPLVMPQES